MTNNRRRIVLSKHAVERLIERLPNLDRNQYTVYVSNARYLGKTPCKFPKMTYRYLCSLKQTKNTIIRVYKGDVFIFRGVGKGHQLVTVFKLQERYR